MSTQILMPALSPTMERGKIAKWHVKEGDSVKSGDILADIETDKATMEFEAVDEGRIGKILQPAGAEGIAVNAPIAVLLEEGEGKDDIAAAMQSIKDALSAEIKPAAAAPKKESVAATPAAAPQAQQAARENGARVFASPLAKRIAGQSGIDIAALTGSGPRGRIVKADVEAAVKSGVRPQAASAPGGATASGVGVTPIPDARLFYSKDEYDEIAHDSMRKSIAKRLTSAKTLIPHYYLTIDCDIGELMAARTRLNARAPKGEGAYKLSVNDFIVKAAALSLMKVPEVNASWTETAMLRHHHADIGVAVALEEGLITPIVFRAEEKGLVEISNEIRTLSERARAKQLKPQEFEGGGFAISNLGMFGIKNFTAVINPPQAAIMAVGVGEERAVIRDGKVVPATMMTVTMSCDHRVIDGATGARFLQAFKGYVEEPASMLL
jgi:pyruvate dehydrogenase E2 component (dihydrolipoamide acetyltransferase)